jgi:hypothetical protein
MILKNLQMRITLKILLLIIALSLFPRAGTIGFSRDSTFIHFQLKDQFDHVWTHHDFSGYVTIIVGSDRHGSQYNEIWSFAIYDSLIKYELKDSVKFLAVADTRGVPILFRKMVKNKFPKEAHRWTILDWEGKFAGAYQFVPKNCNLIVINQLGNVVYQQSGKELEREKLNLILKIIYSLFKSPL